LIIKNPALASDDKSDATFHLTGAQRNRMLPAENGVNATPMAPVALCALKGLIHAPCKPVSIKEMNSAIAARASSA
jgi:hypothetical protein